MTPSLYTFHYPHQIRVYRVDICKLLLYNKIVWIYGHEHDK